MRQMAEWIAAGLFVLALALPAVAGEVAAGVVFAAGSATIVAADGASRPAGRGGELQAGETLETGADGRAQLRFRDGASLSLQPSTRFRVDEFHFSGAAGSAEDRGFFSLLKGGFRTITGLLGKGRTDQYRVGTTVATIGIRGTEYSAALGGDGLSVTTVNGQVEVCNAAGCVLVNPGETAAVGGAGERPRLGGGPNLQMGKDDLVPALQQPSPGAVDEGQFRGPPPPTGGNTTRGGRSNLD